MADLASTHEPRPPPPRTGRHTVAAIGRETRRDRLDRVLSGARRGRARVNLGENADDWETIHTIEWMKQVARQARAEGRPAGFVPTMGALHEGHMSLVRAAMAECQPVIASIFVNPTQFGPGEDLQKYPRTFEADRKRLEEAGVGYLFAPEAVEMYPQGFRTWVNVEGLSDLLEVRVRPGHV